MHTGKENPREGALSALTNKPRWTFMRILGSVVLLIAGILFWAFIEPASSSAKQALMFAAAFACVTAALRPYYGPALVIASIMALAHDAANLEAPSAWNLAFLVFNCAGLGWMLRRFGLLFWIGMSLPCWAMASAVPPLLYVALGLVFTGLFRTGIRPLISRSCKTGAVPSPALAHGPLVDFPAKAYGFPRGTKHLRILSLICGIATIAGALLWWAGRKDEGGTLAITSSILGATFGFFLWLNARMRFRIDVKGIHSRVLFREKTLPWHELGRLTLRYVYFPGMALRYLYYCAQSPSLEIAFPNTMTGAEEFRLLIESASGMRWPEPESHLPG